MESSSFLAGSDEGVVLKSAAAVSLGAGRACWLMRPSYVATAGV
jgi:hypothetical protein